MGVGVAPDECGVPGGSPWAVLGVQHANGSPRTYDAAKWCPSSSGLYLSTDDALCQAAGMRAVDALGWLLEPLPDEFAVRVYLNETTGALHCFVRPLMPVLDSEAMVDADQARAVHARYCSAAGAEHVRETYEGQYAPAFWHRYLEGVLQTLLHALSNARGSATGTAFGASDCAVVPPPPAGTVDEADGVWTVQLRFTLDTYSRRDVLRLLNRPLVDESRSRLDTPCAVAHCFGVEAGMQAMESRLQQITESLKRVAPEHFRLLVNVVSWTGVLLPMNGKLFDALEPNPLEYANYKDNAALVAKASFINNPLLRGAGAAKATPGDAPVCPPCPAYASLLVGGAPAPSATIAAGTCLWQDDAHALPLGAARGR